MARGYLRILTVAQPHFGESSGDLDSFTSWGRRVFTLVCT